MEPRIQYARTTDGVRIAFWAIGRGFPLVHLPSMPFSHIQQEWRIPQFGYENLSRDRMLIRYDSRGSGISQRDPADLSLEALTLDLQAVVDHLGLSTFALYAPFQAAAVAITFATKRPDSVSHLVFYCPSIGRRSDASTKAQALSGLLDSDWEMYTETLAHTALGWARGQAAHHLAELFRECVTPEVARRLHRVLRDFDVAGLLPHVKVPTLVLHQRGYGLPADDSSSEITSRIPGARLIFLEKSVEDDEQAVAAAIDEFLAEGTAIAPAGLSDREVEVLRLIAVGKSNREIADHLVISLNTVARHVSHIFAKTGVANRAEAATYANRHRLMPW